MAKRGINKVILLGNLGNDPETRYLPNGGAVTTISLATSESWKDKQSGQQQERTEWHRVVFFSRLAEIAGEYLRKGTKVYVEGSLRTRKWQDQNGQDRWTTEIVANDMLMVDSTRGGGAGGGDFGGTDGYDQMPEAQGYAGSGANMGSNSTNSNARASSGASAPAKSPAGSDFEDDIPF